MTSSAALYLSYAATLLSLIGGLALLLLPYSVMQAAWRAAGRQGDFIEESERAPRRRLHRRIAGLLIGGSLFPLLSGAPEGFLTLACCWFMAGVARAISLALGEFRATRFQLLAIAGDFGMAAVVALPHVIV